MEQITQEILTAMFSERILSQTTEHFQKHCSNSPRCPLTPSFPFSRPTSFTKSDKPSPPAAMFSQTDSHIKSTTYDQGVEISANGSENVTIYQAK